jgi:hypothetical protein
MDENWEFHALHLPNPTSSTGSKCFGAMRLPDQGTYSTGFTSSIRVQKPSARVGWM